MATRPPVVLGRWEQIAGGRDADFCPGGYVGSTLIFRGDGTLDVQRTFGEGEAIRQTWRIGCQWDDSRSQLTLGEDPGVRPSPESLQGFTLEEPRVRATPAAEQWPAVLPCERLGEDEVRLGAKLYRRIRE